MTPRSPLDTPALSMDTDSVISNVPGVGRVVQVNPPLKPPQWARAVLRPCTLPFIGGSTPYDYVGFDWFHSNGQHRLYTYAVAPLQADYLDVLQSLLRNPQALKYDLTGGELYNYSVRRLPMVVSLI